MAGKNIVDMTDEEIDALSPEELEALQNSEAGDGIDPETGLPLADGAGGGDEGDDEGAGAGDDDGAGAGDDDEGGGDGDEGAGAGDDESALTPEQLERLLAGEVEDDGNQGDVPYSRFKQVIDDNRDLKLIARQLAGRGAAPAADDADTTVAQPQAEALPEVPVYDFKGKMREYHKLVGEGKDEDAGTLLDEIEDKRAEVQAAQIARASAVARTEALAAVETRSAADKVNAATRIAYKEFPFLDNRSKDADGDAILAVNAKAKNLISQGKAPDVALLEAARTIGKKFATLLGKPAAAAPKLGADGKPLPAATTGKAPDGKDARSKAALTRNLGIRQPQTPASGGRSDGDAAGMKIDWKNITDEQIDKLPPDIKAAYMAGNVG